MNLSTHSHFRVNPLERSRRLRLASPQLTQDERRAACPECKGSGHTSAGHSVLAAHADAHARATRNGEPTTDNPQGTRRAWEGKRAA